MALINKLSAIGDAIREKTGKSELLTLDAMPDEIRGIETGGGGGGDITPLVDGTFNEVYAKYFIGKPARSCVSVKALPKGVLCEVEVIAVK